MNNKIDNVLFTLLQAKENISVISKINNKDEILQNIISDLNNLIVDYTINTKMSNKDMLDCVLSLYGGNNVGFLDKIKNLRPKNLIKNMKNKITEYHKKKELKNKYEDEIIVMVKEKLKTMIENDKKSQEQPSKENINKDKSVHPNVKNVKEDIINDKKLNQIEDRKEIKKIPIYNKDLANIIDPITSGTFIYKDNNNYVVYRESDNKNKDLGITSTVEFPTLSQAVIYAIDDKLSIKDVKDDFNNIKNNYGNLVNYVIDKRGIDNSFDNVSIVDNINKDLKI